MKGGDTNKTTQHIGDVSTSITLKALKGLTDDAFAAGIETCMRSVLTVLSRNRVACHLPARLLRESIETEVRSRIGRNFSISKGGPADAAAGPH